MPYLSSVLVGVHPISTVSLGFVLTESLQHILDFPKFSLKENVLLAGRLHLVVNRKHTPTQASANFSWISCDNRVEPNYVFHMSHDRLVWEWKAHQVTHRLPCSVNKHWLWLTQPLSLDNASACKDDAKLGPTTSTPHSALFSSVPEGFQVLQVAPAECS